MITDVAINALIMPFINQEDWFLDNISSEARCMQKFNTILFTQPLLLCNYGGHTADKGDHVDGIMMKTELWLVLMIRRKYKQKSAQKLQKFIDHSTGKG